MKMEIRKLNNSFFEIDEYGWLNITAIEERLLDDGRTERHICKISIDTKIGEFWNLIRDIATIVKERTKKKKALEDIVEACELIGGMKK